jgi:hypothetical protein
VSRSICSTNYVIGSEECAHPIIFEESGGLLDNVTLDSSDGSAAISEAYLNGETYWSPATASPWFSVSGLTYKIV